MKRLYSKINIHKKLLIILGVFVLIAALALIINFVSIYIPGSIEGAAYSDSQLANVAQGELAVDTRALEGMKLAVENDRLAMFFNDTSSEMAVLDKESQEWWYSNPVGAEKDSTGSASVIAKQKSILQIEYYNSDDATGILNSYTDCILNETFEYEFIQNGIRMNFEIGKQKVTREMLPAVVEKEKFEEKVLEKLSGDEKELVEEYYVLQKLSEITRTLVKNKYQELYTTIDEDREYYFLDMYTPDYKISSIYDVLYAIAGYSADDIAEDNEAVGYNIEVDEFVRFHIPVEFILEDDSLKVSIPASEISIPTGYHLTEIVLMPYFGCAGLDDEGYLFVADGSGAIIDFNSNKKMAYSYILPVYGEDDGMERTEMNFSSAKAYVPVFGLAYENQKSVLTVIEGGESHASIEVGISGDEGDQNWAGARFELTPLSIEDFSDSKNKVEINMYQEEPYAGELSMRYLFGGKDKADYSGLAYLYREYLQKNGDLKTDGSATRQMDIKLIMQVMKETSFLGIPYETPQTVTTFKQANEIVNQLKEQGVTDINIGMLSWFGGGIHNDPVIGKVSIASSLGGKRALGQFVTDMGADGKVAFGAELLKIHDSWPRFNQYTNASRYLNNSLATGYYFNSATMRENSRTDSYYYLSSRYFAGVLEDYTASVDKYDISGLWLMDAGNILASDFGSSGTIDREVSKELIVNAVAEAAKKHDITLDNSNQYLWKYMDTIINLPTRSSEHSIIDESVPFLQIVLSGNYNYASGAFNRSGDLDEYFLKAVETGGDLYYEWIYESDVTASGLKGVDAEKVYSMFYGTWMDMAIEQYTRIKEELTAVEGKEITHHSMIEKGVYRTEYGDVSVIVNYNEYDVVVDGNHVNARDFKVVR
ncbi:MAG: hypothetical protein IJE60_05455 [Tyzzerella sp.]|nr:hypothetical protein [Tyzzerella sp.]